MCIGQDIKWIQKELRGNAQTHKSLLIQSDSSGTRLIKMADPIFCSCLKHSNMEIFGQGTFDPTLVLDFDDIDTELVLCTVQSLWQI
jgi:hypothetical protein